MSRTLVHWAVLLVAVALACERAKTPPPLTPEEETLFFGPLEANPDMPIEAQVEDLLGRLGSGQGRDEYLKTIQALANLGPPAIPFLGAAIRKGVDVADPASSNPYLVDNLCEVLGRIGDASAEPFVLRALEHPVKFVRIKALQVLGKIGTAAAVPSIAPLLRADSDADSDTDTVTHEALRALLAIGGNEACEAVLAVFDELPDPRRVEVVEGLGLGGCTRALPAIRRFLETAGPLQRPSAAEALLDLGATARGIALLEESLASESDGVRFRALEVLTARREPEALGILTRVFDSTTDPAVRRMAAAGIRINGHADRELLLRIRANAPEWTVRLEANRGLAVIDPEGALRLFLEDLGAKEISRRRDAIRALRFLPGSIGTRALVEIYPTLDDPLEARMVLYSLARIGAAEAVPLFLDVIRRDRRVVAGGGEGKEGGVTLGELAASYAPNFRENLYAPIAEAYRRAADREARQQLIDILASVTRPRTLRVLGRLYRFETDLGLRFAMKQAARELRTEAPYLVREERAGAEPDSDEE